MAFQSLVNELGYLSCNDDLRVLNFHLKVNHNVSIRGYWDNNSSGTFNFKEWVINYF